MTIYLYVKTHRKTGLKYLGKTEQYPYKYHGSGVYWKSHIMIHGYDVETEILRECRSNDEVKQWGLHYSHLWNVVESNEWANLREENGDGYTSEQMKKQWEDNDFRKKVEDSQNNLVLNEKHIFQSRKDGTSLSSDRVSNGTHNFLNSKFQQEVANNRVRNGTHPWLGDGSFQREIQRKRIDNGTHHLLSGEIQRKHAKDNVQRQIENGDNVFLNKNWQKQKALGQMCRGTHPSQQKWICNLCGMHGKGRSQLSRHLKGTNCRSNI